MDSSIKKVKIRRLYIPYTWEPSNVKSCIHKDRLYFFRFKRSLEKVSNELRINLWKHKVVFQKPQITIGLLNPCKISPVGLIADELSLKCQVLSIDASLHRGYYKLCLWKLLRCHSFEVRPGIKKGFCVKLVNQWYNCWKICGKIIFLRI